MKFLDYTEEQKTLLLNLAKAIKKDYYFKLYDDSLSDKDYILRDTLKEELTKLREEYSLKYNMQEPWETIQDVESFISSDGTWIYGGN